MSQNSGNYVKKETMLLVGLGALVVGFLIGIVFSAYQEPAVPVAGTGGAPTGAPHVSSDQADRILALEKEVAANPRNAGAWVQLGNIWFDTNKYDKAIEAYEKSLAIEPGNPDVLTDLGVMYRRTGQPQKAVESFELAIAADPKHDISYFNKGIVQIFDLKDVEAGLRSWQELLSVNPAATAPDGRPLGQLIEEFRARQAAESSAGQGEGGGK